jgi:hypothetical protein
MLRSFIEALNLAQVPRRFGAENPKPLPHSDAQHPGGFTPSVLTENRIVLTIVGLIDLGL